MTHRNLPILWIFLLTLFLNVSVRGADSVRFDFADEAWKLTNGDGKRITTDSGSVILEISGNGTYSNAWERNDVPVLPGRTAMLRFNARRTAGSGGGMTGFSFANFDVPISSEWKPIALIFSIPKDQTSAKVRLGQWMIQGTIQFSDLEFTYLTPSFDANGLADDESVIFGDSGPVYEFNSQWGGTQGNYNRTFVESTVGFNSNRWCFGENGKTVFRFDAPKFGNERFFGGKLAFNIGYFVRGTLSAQYSADGENWTELAALDASGSKDAQLPEDANGVKTFWIRFVGGKNTNLQLYNFQISAPLTSSNGKTEGSSAENTPIGTEKAGVRGTTCFWELVRGDEGFEKVLPPLSELPKTETGTQIYDKTLTWTESNGTNEIQKTAEVRCRYFVADFYREDFGELLPETSDALGLWWCDATRKVTQTRKIPSKTSSNSFGLQMSAAGNDFESCQLVLNPAEKMTLESVQISEPTDSRGNKIQSENIAIRTEFYHFIDHPTDRVGVREFYPDALPPAVFPQELESNRNAPLWFTIYVPAGTPAGDYASSVTLTLKNPADGTSITKKLPLSLHVWGFSIPVQNHSETAYGFSNGTAHLYHNVKSNEDRRRLDDIYFRFLGRYRISPYNPCPMDGISYKFIVDSEHPENSRTEVDFTRFDEAFERAVREYHFTNFSLHLPGMGGGTFHERYEPKLEGFGEETVEYQSMFASMVRQLEAHLREKGWLKMAYIYWFDEPDVKDYEFVKNGMNRIKKYAPGLQTMLTEEPAEDVIQNGLLGKIDIWCPVTPNFNEDLAEKCRANGERFWWYICCWPHEPYCTEFIDHNAIEMRTWMWQTWKYNVVGTLIWTMNYWNSTSAFPDSYQNPYLDPMSYVSGYDTPAGSKRFWGNGDGRFYYPPLSCAVPDRSSEAVPNFEEPVPSIRLEMLREGIEDYEMLWLLREKLSDPAVRKTISAEKLAEYDALLTVPEEITSTLTQFSTNPDRIYARRKAIAEAIETLTELPK